MSNEATCTTCGGRILPGDRFCAHCGAEQEAIAGAPTAAAAQSLWDPVLEKLRSATEGKYEIGRVLGTGGMAAVYLGKETRLDRPVAIKVMSPGLMMQAGMIERFRHEAITVAALNHPNIVTIYTVEETADLHFFVMEYIPGPSLETVIRRDGPLPRSVVKAWMTQVASALGYAHQHGVVHRDVKPANILLDGEGNAIVTDFGIAKQPRRASLTQTGMTLGTPAYMSPEQCTSKEVTAASDQYSLGIVAYEMLAGEPPFTGPSLEVMKAHVEQPPRPITVHRPHCPAELVTAVERMLEKDPAQRWPSMGALIVAIGGRPIAHDDPIRAQLAALASSGARPARVRASRKGGVATASPPEGKPRIVPPARRLMLEQPQEVIVPAGQPPISPAAGQRVITPPEEREAIPDYLQPEAPPPVATLVLSPVPRSLWVGHTLQLEATPLDASGARLRGRQVAWESSDSETADVSPRGVVTARNPGSVTITATSDGRSDSVQIEVMPVRVESVRVRPWRRIVAQRSTVQFTAVVRGSDSSRLTDRPVNWATSDPGALEVSPDGVATGISPGIAELTASCEEEATTVSVRVTEPGAPFWIAMYWWTAPAAAVAILLLWLALRPGPGPELLPAPPAIPESVGAPPQHPIRDDQASGAISYLDLAEAAREEARVRRDAAIAAGAHQIYQSQFQELDKRRGDAEAAWIRQDYLLAAEINGQLAQDYQELSESARGRAADVRSAATTARDNALRERQDAQSANAASYFPSEFGQADGQLTRARGLFRSGRYQEAERTFTELVQDYRNLARRASQRPARSQALGTQAEADRQRAEALAAGANERAPDRLAQTDRTYNQGKSHLSAGRYQSARLSFEQAAAGYVSLANELRAQPPPQPEPIDTTGMGAPRPAAEVLTGMVERLRELLEQEDMQGIGRELYHGEIPSDDQRLIRNIFDGADDLVVRLASSPRLSIGDASATAVIEFRMDFTQTRTRQRYENYKRELRLRFSRTGDGWRLERLEKR